jgi:uncharacterized membrane protein
MKKNIFKLFAILFVTTIGFISCTEEEIVKADYDYIQNPANVPEKICVGTLSVSFHGNRV